MATVEPAAPEGLAAFKQGTRASWAAGDFPAIARRELWPMGRRLVDRVGIRPGDEVLDVACGSGNAAIRAAEDGGRVTGVDLTPELFDAGRDEAAKAGVDVTFVEGDAEALPFDDESFDVVLSVFGCMFAPRHALAAAEIARVLRPGGRLGIFAWTPEGGTGVMFRTLGGYMPPPPPFAQPPVLWGSEEHVRELFAGSGIELAFERDVAPEPDFATTEDAIAFGEEKFGPMIMARRMLPPDRYAEMRATMVELFDRGMPMEYLVTLGTKAA
jgi:SAM-dependent methyltransferase